VRNSVVTSNVNLRSNYRLAGLLILQYCIGIASIGNTFFSIARVLQYFLKVGIGIGIVNTFIEYWYLIYTNINSQYFSIAQERNFEMSDIVKNGKSVVIGIAIL